MIKKLLPLVLVAVAFLGGAAAGDMIGPGVDDQGAVAAAEANNHGAAGTDGAASDGHGAAASGGPPAQDTEGHGASAAAPVPKSETGHGGAETASAGHGEASDKVGTAWFKFPQQFFVPVLHDGQLDSTMILSLTVEMPGEAQETVFAHELKLRDALLRQLLIEANTGGFDGNFTAEPQQRKLRAGLLATAQGVVPGISDILIGDMARQDR